MKPVALLFLTVCVLNFQTVFAAESGVRLLQAELPAKVSLLGADGEQLAAAVGKATLAHQPEAQAILRAALTRGIKPRRGETVVSCEEAKRVFSVSVAAAPTQASALLDLATEILPDCATELAAVMRDYDRVAYDYKNVVDDKNGPVRDRSHDSNDAGNPQRSADDPSSANDPASRAMHDPGDLSERDINGLGLNDNSYGFGTGFGSGSDPGFPGSPGFVGSTPSGGIALPPTPVTAVVNS